MVLAGNRLCIMEIILTSQVMKMVKQAMQSSVRDVVLEWSIPPEVKVSVIPEKVPAVFSGDKLIMYAIIKGAVSLHQF